MKCHIALPLSHHSAPPYPQPCTGSELIAEVQFYQSQGSKSLFLESHSSQRSWVKMLSFWACFFVSDPKEPKLQIRPLNCFYTFKHMFKPHVCPKHPGTHYVVFWTPSFTDVGKQSSRQSMTKTTPSNTAAGVQYDHRERCARDQINLG